MEKQLIDLVITIILILSFAGFIQSLKVGIENKDRITSFAYFFYSGTFLTIYIMILFNYLF